MEPKMLTISIVTLFALYLTVCMTMSLIYERQLSHALRGASENLRLMRTMGTFEGDYTLTEEGNSTMFSKEGAVEGNSTILFE